jgi:hypothetical protein
LPQSSDCVVLAGKATKTADKDGAFITAPYWAVFSKERMLGSLDAFDTA